MDKELKCDFDEDFYVYKHNKTGELYEVIIDDMKRTCNGHEGEIMVCYQHLTCGIQDFETFVQNKNEFLEKFTKVRGKQDEKG